MYSRESEASEVPGFLIELHGTESRLWDLVISSSFCMKFVMNSVGFHYHSILQYILNSN